MKLNEEKKEFLCEIDDLIKNHFNLDFLIRDIAKKLGEFYSADRVAFSNYDRQNGIFIAPNEYYEYRKDKDVKSLVGISIESQGHYKYKDQLLNNIDGIVYFIDADEELSSLKTKDKNLEDFLSFFNIKCALGATILNKEKEVLAIMAMHFSKKQPNPTEEEKAFLAQILNKLTTFFEFNKSNLLPYFNYHVAKSLGVSASILYEELINENKKNLLFYNKESYIAIKIEDIKRRNYLSNEEIRMAFEKLYEYGLIDLSVPIVNLPKVIEYKLLENNIYSNKLDYNNELNDLFNDFISNLKLDSENHINLSTILLLNSNANIDYSSFKELIKTFFEIFIDENDYSRKTSCISKDFLYSLFCVIYNFINEYKYRPKDLFRLFNSIDTSSEMQKKNKVLSLDKKSSMIFSRFWLILFYKLKFSKKTTLDEYIYEKIARLVN